MVAGFAGGLGLSGKGCGALAAAIWMKTLQWLRANPGKSAPMFRFPEVSKLIADFKAQTGGYMRCEDICGRGFESTEAHSAYIEQGGCKELIGRLGAGKKQGVWLEYGPAGEITAETAYEAGVKQEQ